MMKNKPFKQDGITLIELLITLSLLFIVGTLIFNIFINGINASNKAQANVFIQQEANHLLTKLTSWHESNSHYDIVLNKNPYATTITLIPYDSNGVILEAKKEVISSSSYEYSISYDLNGDISACTVLNKSIIKDDKTLPIKLFLRDKKDPQLTFEIRTIISRM